MLLSTPGGESRLSDLIEQTLRPIAGSRAEIADGPSVYLAEHQILPLSMMLHELATNALKHGALSEPGSLIHLDWTTDERGNEHHLILNWQEEGGPSVSKPNHRGFGTKLLQHSTKAEGGEASLDSRRKACTRTSLYPWGSRSSGGTPANDIFPFCGAGS